DPAGWQRWRARGRQVVGPPGGELTEAGEVEPEGGSGVGHALRFLVVLVGPERRRDAARVVRRGGDEVEESGAGALDLLGEHGLERRGPPTAVVAEVHGEPAARTEIGRAHV